MSFDPRSLERLRELGRTLPRPLPPPEPQRQPTAAAASADVKRHRVETETDPDVLFHELMRVSPDGSVPPHLMDRLRDAEAARRRERQAERLGGDAPRSPASPAGPGSSPPPSRQATATPRSSPSSGRRARRAARQGSVSPQEQELYTAFQQLLLEEDEDNP